MKFAVKTFFFTFSLLALTQCAQHEAIETFPELINEETGLREFRFRGADCVNTVYQHIESNCDHRQRMVTETDPATNRSRVLLQELTPDLKEKFKTVVSPTVQYDERNGKIYVTATLRINEAADRDNTEHRYTFEGDLKKFRDDYKNDSSLRYIHLTKKTGPEIRVNGIVYCSDRPACQEIALVFSYLNPGPDGKDVIDSKTFTIDSRETPRVSSDAIPGSAAQRTLELLTTKVEIPEDFLVDDIANPDNRDAFGGVRAPVLPQEPTGILCRGLLEGTDQCPSYVFDSTESNPIHDTETIAEEDKVVDVFNLDAALFGAQEEVQTPTESDVPSAGVVTASANAENPVSTPTETHHAPVKPVTESSEAVPSNSSNNDRPNNTSYGVVHGVSLDDTPAEEAAKTDDTSMVLDRVPRPQPRPENLGKPAEAETAVVEEKTEDNTVVLPTENIPRPKPRPDHITQAAAAAAATAKEEETIQLPTGDNIPRPQPRPANLGQSAAPTGANRLLSIDGRFVFDLSKCSQQLNRLQTGIFNQARGLYFDDGSLRQSTKFSTNQSANRPNTARQQYASDLSILTIEYAACVLEQKYRNAKIDIHDFSARNGGRLSRHSSHQNGLDVDVSYPHLSNSTRGFDSFTDNMTDARVEAALDYAKILYSTQRVHIIFTDTRVKNRFCEYMKSKGLLTNEYKNFINNNLKHIAGHHNHYHVRLKCNSQNEFCTPQGTVTGERTCR